MRILILLILPLCAFASERLEVAKLRFDTSNFRNEMREVQIISSGIKLDRQRLNSYETDSLTNVFSSREIVILKRISRMIYPIDTRLISVNIPLLEIPLFRPNSTLNDVVNLSRLIVKYPDAWQRQNELEPFSYFGFKLIDVKNGYIPHDDFLKEYQEYLETILTLNLNKE